MEPAARRALDLTKSGFDALIAVALEKTKKEGLCDEAFGYRESIFGSDEPGRYDPVEVVDGS